MVCVRITVTILLSVFLWARALGQAPPDSPASSGSSSRVGTSRRRSRATGRIVFNLTDLGRARLEWLVAKM